MGVRWDFVSLNSPFEKVLFVLPLFVKRGSGEICEGKRRFLLPSGEKVQDEGGFRR
jgi:hypothetical protein